MREKSADGTFEADRILSPLRQGEANETLVSLAPHLHQHVRSRHPEGIGDMPAKPWQRFRQSVSLEVAQNREDGKSGLVVILEATFSYDADEVRDGERVSGDTIDFRM